MPKLSHKSARREFFKRLFDEITFEKVMNIPDEIKGTPTEAIINEIIERVNFIFEHDNEIHSGLYTRIMIKSIIYEILYKSDQNDTKPIP